MHNIFTHALIKTDAWFIDKAECFSHWTQRCFGIASPTWERLFWFLCIGQFLSRELPLDWSGHGLGKMWIFWDFFMVLTWLGRFVLSYYRRSSGVGAGSEAVRNSEKFQNPHLRAAICIMAVLVLPIDLWRYFYQGNFSHSLWFECWAIAWVFSACDDLPWNRSKLREWLDSTAGALAQLKPQPAGL